MTDVVRDPYGNPLRQDTKIAALRQARIDALEEAAKVISEMPRTHTTVKMCDVMGMKAEVTLTLNNGPAECAAAIRALISKETA